MTGVSGKDTGSPAFTIETEIAIVGGGLSGTLAAITLGRAGYDAYDGRFVTSSSSAITGSARKPASCGTERPPCSRIVVAEAMVGAPAWRIGSAASAVVRVRRRRRMAGP